MPRACQQPRCPAPENSPNLVRLLCSRVANAMYALFFCVGMASAYTVEVIEELSASSGAA